jgi:hypothetical protein
VPPANRGHSMQGHGASPGLSSSFVAGLAAAVNADDVAEASTPTTSSENNLRGPASEIPAETPSRGTGQHGGCASAGARTPGVAGHPAAADTASTAARDLELYAKKVRWCSDTFVLSPGSKGIVRKLVLDELGTGVVKGDKTQGEDNTGPVASLGEDEEADDACRIRVAAQAHDADTYEELMWMNDIVQQQVAEATENFDTRSLELHEGDVEEVAVGVGSNPRPFVDPAEVESPAAASGRGEEESVASGRGRVDTEAGTSSFGGDEHDDDFVRPKARRIEAPSKLLSDACESAHTRITWAINSSSSPGYGCIFANQDAADAFIRKKFSPVALVPGTGSAPVWACCSARSAMPRRRLAAEKKSGTSAGVVSDDEDMQGKKTVKRGERARAFFEASGCHGLVQVCAVCAGSHPLPRLTAFPPPLFAGATSQGI